MVQMLNSTQGEIYVLTCRYCLWQSLMPGQLMVAFVQVESTNLGNIGSSWLFFGHSTFLQSFVLWDQVTCTGLRILPKESTPSRRQGEKNY